MPSTQFDVSQVPLRNRKSLREEDAFILMWKSKNQIKNNKKKTFNAKEASAMVADVFPVAIIVL